MEKVRAAGVGVTQLLPIQPHPLLLLQVGGQPAQHLQTFEEGWGGTGADRWDACRGGKGSGLFPVPQTRP